jgi:hypothetical protein
MPTIDSNLLRERRKVKVPDTDRDGGVLSVNSEEVQIIYWGEDKIDNATVIQQTGYRVSREECAEGQTHLIKGSTVSWSANQKRPYFEHAELLRSLGIPDPLSTEYSAIRLVLRSAGETRSRNPRVC